MARRSPVAHRPNRVAGFVAGLLLFSLAAPSTAEISPHGSIEALTQYADVVALGTLGSGDQVRLDTVVVGLGVADGTTIAIPTRTHSFRETAPGVRLPGDDGPEACFDEVVVFLDKRGTEWSIVANGLFRRAQCDGRTGYYEYRQLAKPGPYVLNAQPSVALDTDDIIRRVRAARARLPELQQVALRAVETAPQPRAALHALALITHRGDEAILDGVVALATTHDPTVLTIDDVARFMRDVGDPAAVGRLEALYQREPRMSCIDAMVTLANPRTLDFLIEAIERGDARAAPRLLWSIGRLYQTFEARGDVAQCVVIRDALFAYYDADLLPRLQQSHDVLTLIPHAGSVERLRRLHAFHAPRPTAHAQRIAVDIVALEAAIAANEARTTDETPSGGAPESRSDGRAP